MIKFEVTFDEKLTNQLNKFTMKKIWWFYLFFVLLLTLVGAMSWLGGETALAIWWFGFAILFVPLCILFTNLIQKKSNKSMPLLGEQTFSTYMFDENCFTIITQKGDEYYGKNVSKYSLLFKVDETNECYFLYISNRQSHVIPKSCLTEGSLEVLNDIFARNLGEKFKPCKSNK